MYNIDGTALLRFIHFLKPPEISYWEVVFFKNPVSFCISHLKSVAQKGKLIVLSYNMVANGR